MLKSTNWNYPTTIWFGHNRLGDISTALSQLGITNPLIVTDDALVKLPIMNDLVKHLKNAKIPFTVFSDVQPNPTGENIENGIKIFLENNNNGVIAFGGGSALDAGKTIAFMSAQNLNIWDFEDIRDNWTKANSKNIAPTIAIATTAGTGSEVGRAAVITDSKSHQKKIIFHPKMLPSIVILDPNLTYNLPKHITAWTGIDALVHSIEAYLSPKFHPMAEGIALQAIKMIKENLTLAFNEPKNTNARANMLVAAMMGAVSFQKGLGSVHSIAHQLGSLYNMPHGLANSIILPYALKQNEPVIEDKMIVLCKFLDIQNPSTNSFIKYILKLRKKLEIPPILQDANIKKDEAEKIGTLAFKDPSTATNAKKLTAKDLENLFMASYNGNFSEL